MPRRSRRRSNERVPDTNPDSLRTVRENGEAPKSRVRRASQVHSICTDLEEADRNRSAKRGRILKQYKRFPPTDYSTLIELKMEDQSNVCWGMLAFIVDNNSGSYWDMIAERSTACDISTTWGDPVQQRVAGELISVAYDQYALREDYGYLFNVEVDIQEMLLFGKAIEMFDRLGFKSSNCPVDEFLVPDDTMLSLENFDIFARRRKWKLHELWQRIKNEAECKRLGWNREAVLTAMRVSREEWKKSTNQEILNDITSGNVSLTSAMKEDVHTYDFYVKEFDGTISRHIVLQDYSPITSLVNESMKEGSKAMDDEETADIEGMLFSKMKYANSVDEVFSVFIDKAGSGLWHDTPSLAESIFVQGRQYDVVMNSIMDGIKLNMTLMLQGSDEQSTEKLKQIVWGQFGIIPHGMSFLQHRTTIPTQDATAALQYMMSDAYSGIGEYRVQQASRTGDNPTATQRQLDAAESAKISGTKIRRFNEQQTIYHRQRYRRFVGLKDGQEGYEQLQKFKKDLKSNGIPEAAWKWDAIKTITSNMIAGPGSPSYKLMAAEKIIAFTNLTPKDDGQRAAIEDGIAALAGRQNVRRYMPPKRKVDTGDEERFLGLECETFSDPNLNPKNVQAFPDDNHMVHIQYHLNDMAGTINKLEDSIQKGNVDEKMAFPGITRLMHEGAHVTAHLKFLSMDTGKEGMFKKFEKDLAMIQRGVAKIQQNLDRAMKEKQDSFDPAKDPDIQKRMALASIEIDTAQKVNAIKLGGMAQKHETQDQIAKDKAATQIAATRAVAEAKAKQPAKPQPKPNGKK